MLQTYTALDSRFAVRAHVVVDDAPLEHAKGELKIDTHTESDPHVPNNPATNGGHPTPVSSSFVGRIVARVTGPWVERRRRRVQKRAFTRYLQQRIRLFTRLVRIDPPTVWRLAAHGAVLVLTVSVFLVTRYATTNTAEASGGRDELAVWAQRLRRDASEILPQPVIGTELGGVAVVDDGGSGPGFLSTGLLPEADQTLLPWDEPQRYIVQPGDTISGIAATFSVEPETVLFANPDLRDDPHNLAIGQEVTILPVDGVLHVVADGDTLATIAEEYEADVSNILAYTPNGLTGEAQLVAGTEIVVPGGQMDIVIPTFYEMGYGTGRNVWVSDGGSGPVAGTGSFYAASYGRISQGFHRWHGAIDIANSTGTPVYAIDSGLVEHAGWYGWAGNAVIIDHGNGFESLYAHLNSYDVNTGQTVQRGQIIGGIGCTRGYGGRCTGPHLHLEVYYHGGRVNPCAYGACP